MSPIELSVNGSKEASVIVTPSYPHSALDWPEPLVGPRTHLGATVHPHLPLTMRTGFGQDCLWLTAHQAAALI